MHSPLKQPTHFLMEGAAGTLLHDRSYSWLSRYQWHIYRAALVLSDGFFVGLAFLFAYWLRFSLQIPIFATQVVPSFPFYQSVSLLLIALYTIVFAVSGLYSQNNLLGGTTEYALVFRATTISISFIIIAGFLDPYFILARGWLLLAWVLSFVLVAASRFTLRRIIYRLRTHGYFLTKALIVGANDEGRLLAGQLSGWRTSGLNVIGFMDGNLPAGSHVMNGLHALGDLSRLEAVVARYNIKELIITTSALSRAQVIQVFEQFGMREGINLRLSSGLFEIITTGLQVRELAFVPLVRVNKMRLTGLDSLMKKALDMTLALVALPIIAPLLLLIALYIRRDSPGPVIYRRRVMGANGTEFDAYKFRTMHLNGDEILAKHPELQEELAQNHKLREDPRITRAGCWLRKTSLDELPQIFNVLKGQMSLVGPRMISPAEMEMYDTWGMNLLTVKPGITGLWQVSGRSDLSYEDRVRLDMHYIRNWTIWLDLQILFQTLPAVLKRRGAY